MSTLVDTNVLLRRLEPAHAHHRDALDSIARLIESGETLYVSAQSIGEFCAAATGPPAQNGLGLDIAAVASAVDEIERTFGLLLSDEATGLWSLEAPDPGERMTGRRVFDARLIAVMLAHGIARLLTFNGADFAGLGIVVLDPQAVRST